MVTITDPTGELTAEVDPDGTISLNHDGTRVLDPSPYGIRTPYGQFPDDFALREQSQAEIDETYELSHGKESSPHYLATETTLTFAGDGGTVDLQVRVATDGVAYRYHIEGDHDQYLLPGDESGFRFPDGAVAWVSEYQANHEGHSCQSPVTALEGEYNLPGLFRVGESWALIAEAGVDGTWMAGRLTPADDHPVGVDIAFPEASPTSHVWGHDPVTSPWRVAIVGDLATVVESTLPTDLIEGPAFDPEWVEPGRVAWSWWSSGSQVRDLETQQEYVDYAAERGWEYVLVDFEWDEAWIPDLVEYANERGIGVELWANFIDLNTESKREQRLSRWSEWGVAGIKVDFMDSDDQGRMQFYADLAADAAEYELTVNFHGSAVPTGLRRRYPNIMTYEGVRGAEYYKWDTNTPEHNTILPFTRNVVGPMDYTPVTFSAERRLTSAGHELALSVVYESGLQHFADSIESYADQPLAEDVLAAVPAAWDETVFLGGHPGSEATLARRRGEQWFIGSITAGPARTVEVSLPDLEFLDASTTATVTTDAGDRDRLEAFERDVSPGGTLSVPVAEHGGFVARL
ncbi:putative alpha-glucosidase [Halorhabdus utahensis DSM 12940]|uniref:Putative alpha-glucosidase n=1 Tax=Halorhabdus utahensis (strain DSM 12940 / JCM 11049 / AX-2) TaxID=519442 RepID=C7NML6_HALUD|nr:glycoside hydrolase family 97 protein [Halorhabdus utahensis]ACV11329.1 putative alpha-glucosidase [Halorhabdus utahensis DSM 12940]